MAYKKYIKRNGKLYGPYVYQSKRVNGKVVSEYMGADEHKKKTNPLPIVLVSIFIVAVLAAFFILNHGISGNAVFDVQGNMINGSLSNGNINIVVNQGELIPAGSQLVIENNGSTQTYNLSDLLSSYSTSSGNFYLQGASVSGSGNGYGLEGQETIYPTVKFEIQLSNSTQNTSQQSPPVNSTNGTGSSSPTSPSNSTNISQTNATLPTTNQTNSTAIPTNQTSGSGNTSTPAASNTSQTSNTSSSPIQSSPSVMTSNSSTNSSSITGAVIAGITGLATSGNITAPSVISGQASHNNNFQYDSRGFTGAIIPGSVNSNGTNLSDNEVSLTTSGSYIIVSTDYSITQKGYGAVFLGAGTETYSINLSKLNSTLKAGSLTVKLVYNGNTIMSLSETLSNASLTQTANQTNSSIESSNLSVNLTQGELDVLMSQVNLSSVQTSVSTYQDKYLVDFTYGPYTAEYSYPQTLNNNQLLSYIARDKTLWLKDIADGLQETSPPETLIGNLSGSYSL